MSDTDRKAEPGGVPSELKICIVPSARPRDSLGYEGKSVVAKRALLDRSVRSARLATSTCGRVVKIHTLTNVFIPIVYFA